MSYRKAAMLSVLLAGSAAAGFFLHSVWFMSREGPAEPAAAVGLESTGVRPEFSLKGTDGALHSISEWDGKALLINFWATWCAPCRREIPLLVKLQETYGPQDLQVIGVAVDNSEAVAEFLAAFEINYPILVGQQDAVEVAAGFGVDFIVLPFTAVVDRNGRVVEIHTGELSPEEADQILGQVL